MLSRYFLVNWRKLTRPWCKGNKLGNHTMISYESRGIKKCADCPYTEEIYTKGK